MATILIYFTEVVPPLHLQTLNSIISTVYGMVFGVYRTNHPATAVDHCCHCYFINCNEPNLIVAGGSFIRIFRYVPMQEDGQIKHRLEQVSIPIFKS